MVSVIMLTYQHAAFIEVAINGVLMQTCNFPIELIVADDKSPDGTEQIVNRIVANHPNGHWIKYTKHSVNKGANANYLWALTQVHGDYIALCEGDDYWTDEFKLQKQVAFMEENADYAMTFHNATLIDEKGTKSDAFNKIENRDYSQTEIFENWLVPTASMVFKKEVILDPSYTAIQNEKDLIFGDNLLLVTAASIGKMRGFSDNMSVYRKHSGGMTHKIDRKFIEAVDRQNLLFARYFPDLHISARKLIAERNFAHFKTSFRHLRINETFYYGKKWFKSFLEQSQK